MAETKGGDVPYKGHAGPYTFYERMGKTIMRQTANKRSGKGRTAKSMKQRTLTSNIISLWRAFQGALHDCFEGKKAGSTDFNAFMSVNRRSARVHLTKDQAEKRISIADNVCVSSGSLLPCVQVSVRTEWMVSDIAVGGLVLGPETTVAQLCGAIVGASRGRFREGDEIRFLRLYQNVEGVFKEPRTSSGCYGLTLRCDDFRPIDNADYNGELGDGFCVVDGCLAARNIPNSLVAWVQLRREPKGDVLATTQNLVGTNVLLERFTSEEQLQEAIHSYGPLKEGLVYAENTVRHREPSPTPSQPMTPAEIMEEKVVISTSVSPSGTGLVRGGGTCSKGMLVALQATPLEGYRFLCWDDGDTNQVRTIEATESEMFIAMFIKEH